LRGRGAASLPTERSSKRLTPSIRTSHGQIARGTTNLTEGELVAAHPRQHRGGSVIVGQSDDEHPVHSSFVPNCRSGANGFRLHEGSKRAQAFDLSLKCSPRATGRPRTFRRPLRPSSDAWRGQGRGGIPRDARESTRASMRGSGGINDAIRLETHRKLR